MTQSAAVQTACRCQLQAIAISPCMVSGISIRNSDAICCVCRNHERDWPGTVDRRSALSYRVDSGGECGVIYDKRLGLGMPILKRAYAGLTLPPKA